MAWIIRSYTDLTKAGEAVDAFSSWGNGVDWLRGEAINSADDGYDVVGDPIDGVLEIRDEDAATSVTYVLSEISAAELRKLRVRIPDPSAYRHPRLP